MAQKTMTEKDLFLDTFLRECPTTVKLLRAFPPQKADFKPHERSRSARELAWQFVQEQGFAEAALKGELDFSRPMPKPPESWQEIVTAFDRECRETASRVSQASEQDLNRTIRIPLGPGAMGELRRIDVLWTQLLDQVHHRGQFSVYLRLAGAKVPSIYGPTADEPWG
jgi:uncharacterized damage-inducible protein DinB